MPRTTKAAALVLSVTAALTLAACSDDDGRGSDPAATRPGRPRTRDRAWSPPSSWATSSGTEQTVEEVEVPPAGEESEDDLTCETAVDDHDQKVT